MLRQVHAMAGGDATQSVPILQALLTDSGSGSGGGGGGGSSAPAEAGLSS